MKIQIKQAVAFCFIAVFGWVLNPADLNASDFNSAVSELLETVQKGSDHGPKRLSAILDGSNKTVADQLFIDVTADLNTQYSLSYSPNEIMAYICGMNSMNLSAINALSCIPNFYLGCYSEDELLKIARGIIDLYSQFDKLSADLKVELDKILTDGGDIKLFKCRPNAGYLSWADHYIKNYVSIKKDSKEVHVSIIFDPEFCNTWGLTVSGDNEKKDLTFNGTTVADWAGRLKSYVRKNIIPKMLRGDRFGNLKLRLREQNLTKLVAKIPSKASDPLLFNGAESDADISVLELLSESNWDASEVKRPIHTIGGADIGNLSAASYFTFDSTDTGEFDFGSVVAASSETHRLFHQHIDNSPNRLRILDIGGNNGVNILRHVPKHKVVLCDLNPNALHMAYSFARKHMETHVDNLALSLNKAQDLVFDDCSLDVIMVGYLLKYLTGSEIDALFHNMCKWLKPGGRVYILELSPDSSFYRSFVKDPDLAPDDNWPGQLGRKKKLEDGSVVEANYFLNKVTLNDIKQSLLRSSAFHYEVDTDIKKFWCESRFHLGHIENRGFNGLFTSNGLIAQKIQNQHKELTIRIGEETPKNYMSPYHPINLSDPATCFRDMIKAIYDTDSGETLRNALQNSVQKMPAPPGVNREKDLANMERFVYFALTPKDNYVLKVSGIVSGKISGMWIYEFLRPKSLPLSSEYEGVDRLYKLLTEGVRFPYKSYQQNSSGERGLNYLTCLFSNTSGVVIIALKLEN